MLWSQGGLAKYQLAGGLPRQESGVEKVLGKPCLLIESLAVRVHFD